MMLILLSSCSEQEDAFSTANLLKLSAFVDNTTKAPQSSFMKDDKLGFYTTYGSLADLYNGVPSNSQSLFDGSEWLTSEPVYLTGKPATIYAYYPHSLSAGDGKAISVETASQTDYMFGKGDRLVNSLLPSVNIEMKHALAKITFKIKKVDYPAQATVKNISITGANGYKYSATGKLNCETGAITPSGLAETTGIICNSVLPESAGEFELLVVPFFTPIAQDGDIVVKFTIKTDVKEEIYKVPMPYATLWKSGFTYVYPLTLNGYGLFMNNTDVIINPWGGMTGEGSTI